jgi:hypothetical protein
MPKLPTKITQPTSDLELQLTNAVEQLTANTEIKKFDMQVNKTTGLVRINAQGTDGRTVTKEIIGPGLQSTMTYEPAGKAERDQNIRALLRAGMTQAEVAARLGVSQALVSKVHRSEDVY